MRKLVFALLTCGVTAGVFALAAGADVKITDQPYVRHDGGTDVTIASCSNDTDPTAAGERQQNEPAAAIDPLNASRMTAGSNDYCATPTVGDAYAGFYWSIDRGATWKNSLLPGYATDTSAEGSNCNISPQHCSVLATGDPVQAFDRWNHVYYGVIGFNRVKPSNGSIFAARYDWPTGTLNPDYRWTARVARGTPTGLTGKFQDKIQLEADRSPTSPYSGNASRPWGNVYVCWTQFVGGSGNNGVWFSRSTDGGRTYSNPQKISERVHGSQFCDIAVTANGMLYVTWRQFETNRGHQEDTVVVNKSTNGGASFGKPQEVAGFIHWDLGDLAGVPREVREEAMEEACEQGDGIDCAEREGEEGPTREQTPTRDCGDGPFVCESGYVFFREDSQPRIAADPTDTAHPDAAYIVYNATVPGTQTSTGTSYGTVEPGIGSQGQLYFVRTKDTGGWTAPAFVSHQPKGHQFFPDIDANAGTLHVVWQDSRADSATGPGGRDYRAVPISNQATPTNPPGSISSGPGLDSYYATSSDRGGNWTEQKVSDVAQMPQYEQFGNRDIPFFGDYNSIAAVGSTVLMDWTDQRETRPGTDPRYTNGDGTDGFDVWQCRTQDANGVWSADTCPNAGGLDQNIFGAVIGP